MQHDTNIPPLKAGIKFDSDKPDYSLLPPDALDEVVKVLTFGKNKYSRDNWRLLDDGENRYFAAAHRHLWAIRRGEITDPETGLHHAAHAAASVMLMLQLLLSDMKGGQTQFNCLQSGKINLK
jgi:hypothetical protein